MRSKPTIRLDFCDFGEGLDKVDNFFTRLLSKRFHIELSTTPWFVICNTTGYQQRLHQCVRINFDAEGRPPDFSRFDYALTSDYLDDPRHLRLPLCACVGPGEALVKSESEIPGLLREKREFCSFVVGNITKKTQNRIDLFHRLSRYRRVDSGGRSMNNIGRSIPPGAKHEFLLPYKFNLCYENRSQPGYTTEKIYEAMRARCIPIYWGSPQIHTEFNPKSFINALDFPNEESLAEHVRKVDQDEALYLAYLREPYFHNNQPNESYDENRLLDFFERIFSTPIRPVSSRRRFFQLGRWICIKKGRLQKPPNWT